MYFYLFIILNYTVIIKYIHVYIPYMKRLSSVYFLLNPSYHVISYGNIILDLCLFYMPAFSGTKLGINQELTLLYIATFCLFV